MPYEDPEKRKEYSRLYHQKNKERILSIWEKQAKFKRNVNAHTLS